METLIDHCYPHGNATAHSPRPTPQQRKVACKALESDMGSTVGKSWLYPEERHIANLPWRVAQCKSARSLPPSTNRDGTADTHCICGSRVSLPKLIPQIDLQRTEKSGANCLEVRERKLGFAQHKCISTRLLFCPHCPYP